MQKLPQRETRNNYELLELVRRYDLSAEAHAKGSFLSVELTSTQFFSSKSV